MGLRPVSACQAQPQFVNAEERSASGALDDAASLKMTKQCKAISAVPVFHVKDVDASVQFYSNVLGFNQAFRYGTYIGLRIGKCELHICPPDYHGPAIGRGNAYVICDEVDQYFAKIKAAGAAPKREPADRVYGMRDFVILDPDGNQITFGCDNDGDDRPGLA
jgi:catechol 2,3-dioxygenase-like lactoylglutathione lyase family enzyme